MSIISEAQDILKKKKKKDEEIAPTRTTKSSSGGGSIIDDALQLVPQHQEEDDIAPYFSRLGDNKTHKFPTSWLTGNGLTKEKEDERTWFQSGVFEDGYQFGDVTKTILGTGRDLGQDLVSGALGIVEGVIDTGAYLVGGVSSLFGADEFAEDTRNFIKKDIIDEEAIGHFILANSSFGRASRQLTGDDDWDGSIAEQDSLLGDKTDSLVQSGGQLAGQIGLQAVGVPWYVTSGVTSFGGEVENAFNQDASYGEAGLSGVINAGAEILSEKLFGGSGLGEKGLINVDLLTKGIANKATKALLDYGIDVVGEGAEEVASQFFSNLGTSLYREENLKDILFSEEAIDGYIESAIGGSVLGGVMNTSHAYKSTKNKTDYRTGLTANDQKVFDKVFNDRLEEATKEGKKPNEAKIRDELLEDINKGYISTEEIESVLGGESYKAYKDTVERENALLAQQKALQDEYNALNKMAWRDMTGEQFDRRDELKTQLPKINAKVADMQKNSQQSQLKSKLGKEVFAMVKDGRLVESYNEHIRSTQDLDIDVTQYDGVARKTIENAIKSGANNSNRVRDFVELSAKAAKAVNTAVDFGDNKKVNAVLENQLTKQINELSQTPVESRTSAQVKELAELQEMLQKVKDGKITVNGVKTKDGILINTQSSKALDFILGHEVTHKLEKTEAYKELQKSLFDYAESLNDLQGRRSIAERLYKNIKGTTADQELTSDLAGEYLFSDYDFVKNFAVEHRNAFQKVLDQIKYWAKVATAGSKEARQLEKAKKLYEDALQEVIKANAEQTKVKKEGFVPASEAVQFNFAAVPTHKEKLQSQFTVDSTVDLPELLNRYDKVIEIWEKLGGELDSKFLNEWNAKKGKDRSFSVFKAQAGYKYNVELSSMCKKGVPLFEAIDTIVKNEVMKELNTDVLGKAEKEILYDLLKTNDFEIPCAICYVEQARQREGVIINDFLNGKAESAKLGWNATLTRVQEEMEKSGVNYTFRNVDRSIATDSYVPVDDAMDEATQDAFYSALQKLANEEIARYNKENGKNRPLLKDVTPEAVKDAFGGMLPSNLKIFKVLFTEPSSRFMIDRDLLYSSMTTRNLSSSHNALYSLFNSQGGVSGYKTKQGTVVYWGDILGKKWIPSTLRNEGGVRNQSNSDFQMYTLIDQAQMYMDFTAKGYYLQAYTKVLSELKLFGLSRGKINASLIPAVKVFKNADGTVDIEKTMENAGLDENGDLLFDDIEGIDHNEAFMLIADPEYSKNIGGICIGYSDNHISKMLDDPRIQLIIGFHDKTNDPAKRYRGARYAKNYNGENEAVNNKDGKTVHIGFNKYVQKAEKMFSYDAKTESFSGTAKFKGKEYTANDIPKLAADMYLDMCAKKNYTPAYNTFKGHENYYKLLADFSLYDSQGNYAPHRKVAYDMPSQVPYLDVNGAKQYMDSDKYIKSELEKELKVRDAISEKLADRSENGIIPQFIKRVNELHQEDQFSLAEEVGEIDSDTQFSIGVTDAETLDMLNEQVARGEYDAETNPDGGYYVTYKSMSFWGYDEEGNAILRSPMAEYVDGELSNAYLLPKDKSKLNWYQATETIDENTGLPSGLLVGIKEEGKKSKKYVPASENQDLIAEDWSNLYFMLNKKVFNKKTGKWKNSPVPARYNPYEHSSNSMLNDQFKAAWQRDNLVTVKMYVPRSEDNGAYRAQWSKDPTGWADWKSGDVAGKINKQKDLQRRVYLSRYAAPVEIVPDSEVAQAYKGYIEGTDVEIPDNVVSPNLLNELKKAGVTIQESGQVQYSISDSEGRALAPAVQIRFARSKVVDENGNLKAVYHGTASGEFFVFDKAKGSVEGDFGSGFYFTDNADDVARNYEGGGPDFENKIARRAEQIEAEEEISYIAARKRAIQELYKGSHKFEVYLNIENPAIVGKTMLFDPESYFGQYNEEDYDSYEDYEGDVEQLLVDEVDNILWDIDRNVDVYNTDGIAEVLYNAFNEGGIGIEDLKHQINNLYLEDSNGNLVGNEVTRQIIESLGYDGIIDPTVSGKWNMDMEEGTTHYIVFKPNQIKSVTNENPTDDPDIRHSLSEEGEDTAPVGNHLYGKDFGVKSTDDIAPYLVENEATAPVAEETTAPIAGETTVSGNETQKPITRRGEYHKAIVDNIKSVFAGKGYDFDEVLKNAKNLSTFSTVDNTPQRVMEKALGYKEGNILSDITVNKVAQNETEGIKWLNSFTNRKDGLLAQISKQYNIKPGSKESSAAQMYAEGFYVNEDNEIVAYGDAELAKDFPDANVQRNIKGLANDPRIRQVYDETLAKINESRARNLYPEIPRLDNYFLHFRAMDDTFSRLGLPFNPNDIRAKDLPTDLNGVTADLKPGQPYFASAMHRKGKRTSFDLLGGLERYLSSAKNQIYHIDDIQTLRALRNYIADTYGQANGLEGLDALSEEAAQEKIEQVFGSHLSTFAKFLNEEANVLAGKTALIDRGLEGIIGRRGITTLDTINKQVGSNMVGFSVPSALTNFDAIPRAFVKSNKADFVKSFAQTVSNRIRSVFGQSDGFAENSPVMIRRKGADRFYRTLFQKVGDAGYVLMGTVDDISTELIARTKYNEFTRNGMDSQQAHFETDKWVSKLMGDRSLGQQPQLFNSKMLGLITKFQLEVRNNLDSMFYDTIQEAKASTEDIENELARNAKRAAKVTSTMVGLAVAQHLFGKAFESVAGYNPSFDIVSALIKAFGWDDEEEEPVLDNIEQAFLELVEDMPYTSTFTGGRIPIASALPIEELVTGKDSYGNEKSRLETLGEIAPYYVLPGGYGQFKKTRQGLGMFSDDHPVAGSYTDSGSLRFPVEDTLGNRIQAALFGQYANENARDYFDNERSPLKEKQIQEFIDVDIPIRDYWEYREGLSEQDTLEDKFDYIAGLDLPVAKKNILINNIVDRKEPVDMEGYEDFSGYEEFDFATKYPEKYEFFEANNISFEEYQNADEDEKRFYSDAYEAAKKSPAKVTMAKAVSGSFVDYYRLTRTANNIKGVDLNGDGKTDSGSKKANVKDYIFSLDLDYGQKIILFRSMYDSKSDKATYNMDIVNYLDSRSDISYEEMVAILEELDFKVDGNYVSWD